MALPGGDAPRILLASASPRRSELLGRLGVPFRVEVSRFEEAGPGPDPHGRVMDNARGKAREVAARAGVPAGGVVLGCDTEVALDGVTLGQPPDEAAALRMVHALAGRTHEVLSGVVVLRDDGREWEQMETVEVSMRWVSPDLAEWYVATGEWQGKAGGYAIQGYGCVLVDGIRGDYTAVVGLPMAATGKLLERAGIAPWSPAAAG